MNLIKKLIINTTRFMVLAPLGILYLAVEKLEAGLESAGNGLSETLPDFQELTPRESYWFWQTVGVACFAWMFVLMLVNMAAGHVGWMLFDLVMVMVWAANITRAWERRP